MLALPSDRHDRDASTSCYLQKQPFSPVLYSNNDYTFINSYKMSWRIQKRVNTALFFVILCLSCASITHAATLTAPSLLASKKQRRKHHKLHSSLARQNNDDSLVSALRGGSSSSAWMVGLKDSVASALAAACSKTILAPFDTIKTIQQQYQSPNGASLGFFPACRIIMKRPGGFWNFYVRL